MHQNKILCLQSRPKMSDLSRLCAMCDFCVLGIVNVNVKLFLEDFTVVIFPFGTHTIMHTAKKNCSENSQLIIFVRSFCV